MSTVIGWISWVSLVFIDLQEIAGIVPDFNLLIYIGILFSSEFLSLI